MICAYCRLRITKDMLMAKKTKRAARKPWSKTDLRDLKLHSKSKTAVAKISRAMKRTVGAVRQQAFKLGIPLGHRR
jgi:hypothetical protein